MADNLDVSVALVSKAQDGVVAALDELLGVVRPAVHRFSHARLCTYSGGAEVAEDVTQEVCLAVVDVLPRYTDRGAPFAALVYAIASNKVADAQRRYSRNPVHAVDEVPDSPSRDLRPDEAAVASHVSSRVAALVGTLPEKAARIVTLRAHGYSAGEVGEQLGMNANAVRVAHHRALRDLRHTLLR